MGIRVDDSEKHQQVDPGHHEPIAGDRPISLSGQPALGRLRAPGSGEWSEEIRRDKGDGDENRRAVRVSEVKCPTIEVKKSKRCLLCKYAVTTNF